MSDSKIWTRAESKALDQFARRFENRPPLRVDPKLWELLQPDRENRRQRFKWDGSPCTECDSAMRPSNTPLAKYPGTRAHVANGICKACYARQYRAASSESVAA